MNQVSRVAAAVCVLALSLNVTAAPIVYPSNNQPPTKQARDDSDCNGWAKTNTGVDPAAIAAAGGPPPPPPPGGQRVAGAVVGAGVGAIIGDNSRSAGAGAAVGALAGGAVARGRQAAAAGAAQQQQAQKQQAMATFYKAYGACMTGRGYTVN